MVSVSRVSASHFSGSGSAFLEAFVYRMLCAAARWSSPCALGGIYAGTFRSAPRRKLRQIVVVANRHVLAAEIGGQLTLAGSTTVAPFCQNRGRGTEIEYPLSVKFVFDTKH